MNVHNDKNVAVTVLLKKQATVQIELPWPAVTGNHAVKHTRTGGHYKTPQAKAYEAAVAAIVVELGLGYAQTLKGPLRADWLLAPPDRRARDLDNVRKTAADALTKAGFWADDSNKVLIEERFVWTTPEPGGVLLLTVEVLS
jgi:crossover junction endodeoxyribonuclease RusA